MQLQPDGAAWSIREEKEGLLTSYSVTSSAGLSGFKCVAGVFILSPLRLYRKDRKSVV